MPNNTEQKQAPAEAKKLSGFSRAIPIILTATAVFIAVCLIFDGITGASGNIISAAFRGLFASGAFAIPALLILHACFFSADIENGTLLSRSIFSVIITLIISSVDYTVFYWGKAAQFAPVAFYEMQSAGGFIGGSISFLITALIGSVGLIIVDIAVPVIYVVVFLGRKDSTTRKAILGCLEFITYWLSLVENKIKKDAEARREAEAEKKRQETEEKHRELIKDQFFDNDNMDALDIPELGIHESRDPKQAEKHPTLHSKVHNKSAVARDEASPTRAERATAEREAAKKAGLRFDIDPPAGHTATKQSDLGSAVFGYSAENQTPAAFTVYDTRELASEVFTKDFDPFDFATGEKLVAKQSSKASTVIKAAPRSDDSLFSVTEESIAEMARSEAEKRRREEFEARKAKILAGRGVTPLTQAEQASSEAPTFTPTAAPITTPVQTVVPEKAPVTSPSPTISKPSAPTSVYTAPTFNQGAGTPAAATVMQKADHNDDADETAAPVFRQTTPHAITTEATFGTPPVSSLNNETVLISERDITDTSSDEEIRKIAESAAWGKPRHTTESENVTDSEITEATVIIPETNPEEKDFDTVAEEIAELVRMNNPAYARSANKSTFTTTVRDETVTSPKPEVKTTPTEAPIAPTAKASSNSELAKSVPLIIEDVTYDTENTETSSKEPEFKPFTPPTVTETASQATAPILVTERELLSPTPKSVAENTSNALTEQAVTEFSESKAESTPVITTTINDEFFMTAPKTEATVIESSDEQETVLSFNDNSDDEDIEDEVIIKETDDFEEEIEEELTPIPPEKQNPNVLKQRAMFPFLDKEAPVSRAEEKAPVITSETEEKQPLSSDPVIEEEETDDRPPFDIEEVAAAPITEHEAKKEVAASLIPVEEKPKKKDYSAYALPPIDLLHPIIEDSAADENAQETQENADKLIETLASFGVTASIKGVDRGPRITRYEVVPARGTRVSNILSLENDIALNLAAGGIRMEAPIPGKTAVGIEIPNKTSSLVRLRELIETDEYQDQKSKTTVCMGKDVAGQPIFADVAKMPHALVAGATGMGKSVWINSMMISILYKARPDEVKFIMIDPKQVEFTMYNGIPHLLVPVVSDVKQAAGTLMWAVEEMERRYSVLKDLCVRNIDAYNDKVAAKPGLGEPMSRIIIVIDEFAELIMQAKNPVENLIIRIAQKARAAGIHLIIGTQKPVKEVITGLIKSNIPSKFSCKVAQNRDSILIFDSSGAEKLLDKGDMLVSFANSLQPLRVQSAFVADDEVETVMEYLRQFSDGESYDEEVMEEIRRAADKCSKKGGSDRDDDDDDDGSYGEGYLNDKQFLNAVELAVNTRKISTSLIQRKMSIGYSKAAKFIDVMEDMGIVGESNGSKPREVLITPDEWHEKLARTNYD